MSKFTRPTFSVDDDDLERLQQEFFDMNQTPSAKVIRKSKPPTFDPPKKRSLFAERLAQQTAMPTLESSMPTLESNLPSLESTPPALEDTPAVPEQPIAETLPTLDTTEDVTYEPVMDPHPEPHVPVSKKMLDLTSLLGQVLGEIKEHDLAESVTAPSLTIKENTTARGQHNGFPKPVHRSEFKKRLEAKRQQKETKRLEKPPVVSVAEKTENDDDMFGQENDRRIRAMSEQELDEAREEIMSTLSPESIALLMKGLKHKTTPKESTPKETATKKTVRFSEDLKESAQPEDDLIQMKERYFPHVPLENEKLAWLDARFMVDDVKTPRTEEGVVSETEKVYRGVRFDLQGRLVDPKAEIAVHRGLHHHGDEPDKAGYTLAELFYLTRSQMPSQRAMVLTTLARIIQRAKAHRTQPVWSEVWTCFSSKEYAATVYLRSALDDRHLVVLVSAIQALAALVLDEDDQAFEASTLETAEFNRFLGHIARPILAEGVKQIEKKGLNEKLSELVDRVRQGQEEAQVEAQNDAELAEKDLVRGLIKMNLLPRIRYLISTENNDLIEQDPGSVERLVRILVRLAEAGQDVCELIVEEEELLEPVIAWGLDKTEWPMTGESTRYPSLAAARLMTVLAQGSKKSAEKIVDTTTLTLRFLATPPSVASEGWRRRAYGLQLETLRLIRVLACYGYIVPVLEDLQTPVMSWLRAVLEKARPEEVSRAATAIGLLEVLLQVAADPHKSIPAHAIDWPQPTAYLPAIVAVLKANGHQAELRSTALGYLSVWADHLRLFPPEPDLVRHVWKTVQEVEVKDTGYVRFLAAYRKYSQDKEEIREGLRSSGLTRESFRGQADLAMRYGFWLWQNQTGQVDRLRSLQFGIESRAAGQVETWLCRALIEQSVPGKCLEFYLPSEESQVSKALFECDGRGIETLMYTAQARVLNPTGFLLSPIDAFYHLDKSRVAQKTKWTAAEVIVESLDVCQEVLQDQIDLPMFIVSVMKIFMIGDREGRQPELETDEREIFWDINPALDRSLSVICKSGVKLEGLEEAWRNSSDYIRQSQVPFFQFYQGFVAHYAAVSFGHTGFARLLVYLLTQIDTVDYRHLVLSDYREILPTLNKIGVNQVPQPLKWDELKNAGLKLSL